MSTIYEILAKFALSDEGLNPNQLVELDKWCSKSDKNKIILSTLKEMKYKNYTNDAVKKRVLKKVLEKVGKHQTS